MAHEIDVQLPLQFEDFYVLSFGEISASPSYYGLDYIWPIGYRSCWHEKVTASLYTCEVSDNGDGEPVFTVRRCSCSTHPTPCGSTVLCRADQEPSDIPKDKNVIFMDSTNMDHDEYDKVLKTLPDIIPPSQMDLGSSSDECPAMQTSNVLLHEASDNLVSEDFIGELLVEDSSPSSAWKLLLEKVADALQVNMKRGGSLQCFCEHAEDLKFLSSMQSICPSSRDQVASLGKFGSQHRVVQGEKEYSAFLKSLTKWLRCYRFGLDIGFVQEIIEQLPGAGACSGYISCKDRLTNSSLTIVNKKIKIKEGIEGVNATKGDTRLTTLTISSKRESMLITEETAINKQPFPLGSLISSRLSSYAVGNLLQVHGFLCRFQENLGVEDLLSFDELEKELLCPWMDSLDSPEEVVQENFHDFSSTVATHGLGESSILETLEMNCTRCMGDKLTTVHQALLPELVSELLDKIASVVNIASEAEVSKSKWGHKKDTANRNMAKRIKLDMIPINQLTWPEVVRRYILAYLLMGGRVDFSDIAIRNNTKLIRCLQGDGGICCCPLTGVAGVDVDAQLLGRAVDEVFDKLNGEGYAKTMGLTGNMGENSDKDGLDTGGSVPEWAKVLDPVRKLATNVGSRIRNPILYALEKNPPDWARKLLKASISKGVYKGNAAGPTKRAVIEVLDRLSDEAARPLPPDRKEKRTPELISKFILKKCRIILRHVAACDINRVFSDLVGRNFNSDDDDVRFVFGSTSTRPLDLRTIDRRLLHGSYGGSHEAFLEDVRELWINLQKIHSNRPSLVKLADELSKDFESRYESEVASQFGRFLEYNVNGRFTKEVEKELEEQLNSLEIPEVPWETGICKVCGLNRDDNNVLLCDKEGCNAEYHTYCLSPPLSEIPEGEWYCPECAPRKQLMHNASEGPRHILQFLNEKWEETGPFLDIATALEETEYWELGADKKTFLLKVLCDELLDTARIRDNLDLSRPKLDKLMRKCKSLKSRGAEFHKRPDETTLDFSRGRKYGPAPNVVDNFDTDRENDNSFVSDDHLTKQLSRLSLRKEFLGIDSDGRLYWGFPETSPHYGIVVNEDSSEISPSDHPPANHSHFESSGSWRLYQADDEINDLIDYLRRNDPEKTELRDSILQWQQSMLQSGQPTDRNLVKPPDSNKSPPNRLATKATVLLEAKYGLHSEPDAGKSLKKPRRKNMAKWHRCDCLEPVLPSRSHCVKCHETFFTNIEFEHHTRFFCGQSSSSETSKLDVDKISETSHKASISEIKVADSPKNRPSPVSGSSHDGSNTVAAKNPGVDGSKQVGSDILVSKSDPFSEVGGNFIIPGGSLKPIVGKALHILQQLKINLLDMEAALPDGAKRASWAGPEWRSAWCTFVKSANTIYEMVQAIMVFETMIKTEYIKNTWWWYWSSASVAAKTSTMSALALRIYTLDAAIDYQKTTTTSSVPKHSKKRKEASSVPKQSKKRKEASEKTKKSEDKNKKSRPVKEQKDGMVTS
ncbi:hypothetical protein L6452_41650 [Arctium lappa]|uniref:Uncharacterized protein n=1 Tax=Arctium lappa TaxID=4217 RepID=A0ACB8XPB3_ARCLA|nr:hypothetical protein L6452_41650 [Arctium lappa]